MLINLNDPDSVLRWWRVWPERHHPLLEFWLKTRPEFAPSIREVQRRLSSDPDLVALMLAVVNDQKRPRQVEPEFEAEMLN
ncbi:hypothetical protein [Paucibacter sp. KBW04]|uniref:hypothetical protein n=1 Tax=Paucibacter sp. KBW04 TaxID=2153361 RepID=UPI000F563F76|nr:hypothetical protein [Paucibacter sp. KBW04]